MASRLVAPEARLLGKEHEPELSDSEEILLRAFRPDGEDERQMRELVFDNAFLGEPFDVICPCKEWFSDVVLTPYIKYQPENIQVAVHRPSGRLIGYLTGSLGGQELEGLQYKLVKKKVISLALSLTMPWTFFDLSSRLFATHVIFRGEGERPILKKLMSCLLRPFSQRQREGGSKQLGPTSWRRSCASPSVSPCGRLRSRPKTSAVATWWI